MASQKEALSIAFLFDDTLDSNDGVAQNVKCLGLWLEGQGHSVAYLVGKSKTKRWGRGPVYSLSNNLPVSWGGNRLSIPIWSKTKDINKVLNKYQFDVLHVQFPYSPFMSQRVINRVNPYTVVVGTCHVPIVGSLSTFGSKLLRLIYGRSLKRFDNFLSVSTAAQDYARLNFGLVSEIVPNPVDIEFYKKARVEKKRPRRIVFLGRLVERKGCGYLLKAFALLHQDVELIVAGDGPHRPELERVAHKLGITGRVKFLGYIDEDDKPDLLAGADIACFPALYGESFGIVLIEAMAAGAGVVLGGDNPGYRSVLGEQPKTLINPKQTQEFANILQEFLDNPAEAQKLHAWQQKEVERYDVNVVGKQLLVQYRAAIAKRPHKRHNEVHARA